MKFRQIGHTTSQYGQSFFPKTISAWNRLAFVEAPSLAVFRSTFLNNYRASLPHNIIEGSCGILKQKQITERSQNAPEKHASIANFDNWLNNY